VPKPAPAMLWCTVCEKVLLVDLVNLARVVNMRQQALTS